MLWTVLMISLLFPSFNCDDTAFHLYHYLNHSVSPCSDFYGHVCSIEMNLNKTVRYKTEQFYQDLADKLESRSRNNPIMNDIISAREIGNCTFDSQNYKNELQKRCASKFDCYLDEFYYFFNIYNMTADKVEDTLSFFAVRVNRTGVSIPKLMNVTSRMIEWMIRDSEEAEAFEMLVDPYEKLHDRLSIMSELGRMNTTSHVGLSRLRKMTSHIKESIADRFIATQWLNETDSFDLDRFSQFLTILDEITIMADFDELDANLTLWRRIDRFITEKYFEYSKRSTGCSQFDVIHPFVTLQAEMEKSVETGHDWQVFMRITEGLVYNAFNGVESNSIVLLAPIFYPIMWENSSDTTLLGFGAVLAHEMFHSFIKNDLSNSSRVFRQEADCIIRHFNSSCQVWARSECSSGAQTFEEDGPDVEGLRVAFDLLNRDYSEQQLKELEYEDLGITREQAFFYAFGVRFCGAFDDDPSDEHSSDNVRLNVVVSMLPEFSTAFQCHNGDEEYSRESSTCYLFGPLSGVERSDESSEETDTTAEGDEGRGEESTEQETSEDVITNSNENVSTIEDTTEDDDDMSRKEGPNNLNKLNESAEYEEESSGQAISEERTMIDEIALDDQ